MGLVTVLKACHFLCTTLFAAEGTERVRIFGQTDVLFEEAADHDLAKHMTQLGT